MEGTTITTYNTIAGFVQFDPNERKTNTGTEVRDVVIQAIGSGGKNVKITIWPEFSHVALEKGSFLVANGKYTEDVVDGTTYRNLSATVLFTGTPEVKKEPEVEGALEDDEEELLF